MNIQKQYPYYDDYDQRKNYTQILAQPGMVEQAREFTQAQTIMRDFIERVGHGVFKEGSIITGCACIIDKPNGKVTIQPGRIFLEGLVRIIDNPVELLIDGVGVETINAKIKTSIITALDDESLRDPAQAYENFNQEGANRLKEEVEFSVNSQEENCALVYTLVDGETLKEIGDSDYYAQINNTLARRTYDENGNYKVSGLSIRTKAEQDVEDKIGVTITQGKAYVNGFEVEKGTFSTLYLDKSMEKRTISDEPKVYSSTINKYYFNYYPVASVSSLKCQIQVTNELKQRISGGIDGAEALNYSPVVSILSVFSGDTNYVKNRDYKLYNDQVDWSLTSDTAIEPDLGSSYYVTYTYNKQMELDKDFVIESDADGYYIRFITSDVIVENSSFDITYDFFLSRRDLILMDSSGVLSCIQGKSDRINNLITPYNMDVTQIELGYVDIYPDSKEVVITNYKTERMTQAQIYNLSRRIDDIEYNQALSDLDTEAAEGESATSLKGIYTDGFIGISKCDLNYYVDEDDKFDCCIDYDMGEMTLPVSTESTELNIRANSSVMSNMGRVISAPFTHVEALSQMLATGKMLVNPYAAYNPLAKVTLNPAIDNWIDTEKVQVYDEINKTNYNTTYKTYSHGWWSVNATHNLRGYLRTETSTKTSYAGTSTSTAVSTKVTESVIEFMRSIELKVSGDSFEGGEDNIQCYFNEVLVAMTPIDGSSAGTTPGSMRSDENGSFRAKITIPSGTPTGSVEVLLKGPISSGRAIFTAKGTKKTTTVTTTTTNTANYNVLVETHNLYASDPLAQTFMFGEDTVLTKLGLYFSAKDATRPAVLQVRDVVNGYPGETIYAEQLIESSSVTASTDASIETQVDLNQPVYCRANTYYCFVVLSDSNAYEMFYGELAKTTIDTNKVVTSNPYPTGVMFSSSNSSTWTAHQTCDLKFKLYKAHYTGNGEILFNDVTASQINGLLLAAEYVDYKNAGIDWYYRLEEGTTWLPLDTYVQRELDNVSSLVQLRAVLNVKYQTSPFIASDCINLIGFIDSKRGIYVSRSIYLSSDYTNLKIQYQLAAPSGSSCRVYYMDKDQGNWIEVVQGDDVTLTTSKIDNEFDEYSWELAKINSVSSKYYKIKLVIETNNVFNRPRVRKLRSILKY